MIDAKRAPRQFTAELSPEILRARAQRRRETAERLWDDRLERLLLEEADELERLAAALERDAAIHAENGNAADPAMEHAAPRAEAKAR